MDSNVAQSKGVESVLEALRYENEKLKKEKIILAN